MDKTELEVGKILGMIKWPLLFAWVIFSVIGIMLFPVLIFFKYGLVWWTVLGGITSLIGCCFPMVLEFLESGHVDLRPRFMK